jgi:hypothetical protein
VQVSSRLTFYNQANFLLSSRGHPPTLHLLAIIKLIRLIIRVFVQV